MKAHAQSSATTTPSSAPTVSSSSSLYLHINSHILACFARHPIPRPHCGAWTARHAGLDHCTPPLTHSRQPDPRLTFDGERLVAVPHPGDPVPRPHCVVGVHAGAPQQPRASWRGWDRRSRGEQEQKRREQKRDNVRTVVPTLTQRSSKAQAEGSLVCGREMTPVGGSHHGNRWAGGDVLWRQQTERRALGTHPESRRAGRGRQWLRRTTAGWPTRCLLLRLPSP